jgi:putative aldouronate transport system permease protein
MSVSGVDRRSPRVHAAEVVLRENANLFPLSLFLRNLIAGASTTTAESAAAVGTTSAIISLNIQAVTMILAIIPILFIYPFVQRHFVSGVMLGSVKG